MIGIGRLLGLDPGVPDPGWNGAALRTGLTLGALAWAWLAARARPAIALLAGIAWCLVATGFWVACLQRPYGLFDDRETVLRTADVSVAAASGEPSEGVLSGAPTAHPAWTSWLARGVSRDSLILLPSTLPVLVLPFVAVLLFVLIHPAQRGALAATLWLVAGTGELDATRGLGVLPELWRRPGPALGLGVVACAAFIVARLPLRDRARTVVCAALALAGALLASPAAAIRPAEALLVLTLDQGLLLPIAAVGLVRAQDAASRGLVLGGAAGVLVSTIAPGVDSWTAHALYRLGLIVSATGPLLDVGLQAEEWLLTRWRACASAFRPGRLTAATLVAALAPASFVAWWDPSKTDPAFDPSRAPIAPALTDAMDWIRNETPAKAVFIASNAYGPAVASMGGRRLLRSSLAPQPPDELRRSDAERRLILQRHLRDWVYRYGVGYVFAAPGDFAEYGLRRPEDLASRPGFHLVYANWEGYRVYQLRADAE